MQPRFVHILTIFLITTSPPASAVPVDGDVFADTWVATDALGRSLPDFNEVGPPRAGRHVGLFYFLWVNNGVSNNRVQLWSHELA